MLFIFVVTCLALPNLWDALTAPELPTPDMRNMLGAWARAEDPAGEMVLRFDHRVRELDGGARGYEGIATVRSLPAIAPVTAEAYTWNYENWVPLRINFVGGGWARTLAITCPGHDRLVVTPLEAGEPVHEPMTFRRVAEGLVDPWAPRTDRP